MPISTGKATFACVAAVAGVIAFWVVLSRRSQRRRLSWPWWALQRRQRIFVVNTSNEWEAIFAELQEELAVAQVLGFDCEWVNRRTYHGPVALLQLATVTGLCVLVRLCKIKTLPDSLVKILNDKGVLKVGVAPLDDAKKMLKDHMVQVNGCVDLRNVWRRFKPRALRNRSANMGLAAMGKELLGVTMDKSIFVRCSNWEAETLTPEQVKYGADDALVGVDAFMELIARKLENNLKSCSEEQDKFLSQKMKSMCQGIVDVKFSAGLHLADGQEYHPSNTKPFRTGSLHTHDSLTISRAYSARTKPLYHNCQLKAPDGQLLCTCDEKKAQWYIQKGLGEKISDDPFTVQLKFEPSGRPEDMRNYYLQEKSNICVVCGKEESYIRKHIIPHEYRKYFPSIMKDHLSHDIVLLCMACHQQCNNYDRVVKERLAQECDAPIGTEKAMKYTTDRELTSVKSSAKALLHHKGNLPDTRKQELESAVMKYFGVTELTQELLERGSEIETRFPNEDFVPHGLKVVQYKMQQGSLVEFEKMWRRHFLNCMKPQFLPELWSVDHNHKRLAGLDVDMKHSIGLT